MAIRALYVTSEVYPLAKTGGLADVSAALPAALRDVGIDVRLVVPAYPQALNRAPNLRVVAKLGGMSGYYGGLVDTGIQRVIEFQDRVVYGSDFPNIPYRLESAIQG